MPIRKANAEWKGDLKTGRGAINTESGLLENTAYNFVSRFESGTETNPEELLGAAHSACYSMALANSISGAGFKVNSIKTEAKVFIEKLESGFTITKVELDTVADIEGISREEFLSHAEKIKSGCPVSKALTGPTLVLNARLK